MTVERLSAEHLGDVAIVEKKCFADPWSENSLEILVGNGAFGMVALIDGKVVGYGGMMIVLDEGQITDIAVLPEYRRRGIGMEILKAMIIEAKSRSVATLFLEARESNLAARELYRACGFEDCGMRKSFYRHPTENAVLMSYKIV